jgi:hypothetical protein
MSDEFSNVNIDDECCCDDPKWVQEGLKIKVLRIALKWMCA